jgi:hypothetical protein
VYNEQVHVWGYEDDDLRPFTLRHHGSSRFTTANDMAIITATLKYLQWQDLYRSEKPFICFVDIPAHAEDKRDNNLVFEDRQTLINDVRSSDIDFSLDNNGFMLRSHTSTVSSFDPETVQKIYLPEVEYLLRSNLEEVDKVFFFDWRVSCTACSGNRASLNV